MKAPMTLSTGTLLRDLVDVDLLDDMLARGFISAQRHPQQRLRIFNYTAACQFAGEWNAATLLCRGLVVNPDAGVVLARPFAKFFNYGQPGAPALDPTAPVTVYDKLDGSLGILYPADEGWALATRGSFASDQARHASAVLVSRYPSFVPPPGRTVLFEIIYPGNRIVVDYRDLDDLVLLGSVDIATGASAGPESVPSWPGPVVERFAYSTLADALAAPARSNREGLVVHVPTTDVRVKIKYDEYVQLHRIVTGLSTRTVWEQLAGHRPLDELLESLPDEFHEWVRSVAASLRAEVSRLTNEVEQAYRSIVDELPEGFSRKDFALRVATHPERGCLFLRLDGKSYVDILWTRVKPEVAPSMRTGADDGD
jgi:RNA ligase